MSCSSCGADQPADAGFCGNCGARLSGVADRTDGRGARVGTGVLAAVLLALGVPLAIGIGDGGPVAPGDVVVPSPSRAPAALSAIPPSRPVEPSGPPPEIAGLAGPARLDCHGAGSQSPDPRQQTTSACGRWAVRTDAGTFGRPTVGRDTVVVGTPRGVAALDAHTGAVRWTATTTAPVRARIAVDGGLAAAVDDRGVLHGLDPEDGAVRWRTQLLGTPVGDPVVLGDTVVVALGDHIAGIRDGGAVRWRFEATGPSPVTTAGGLVVFGDRNGTVRALDVSREPRWSTRVGALRAVSVPGRPLLLVVGPGDGRLVALDPDDGDVRWRSDRPVGPMVAPGADGELAFATAPDDGRRLLAVDLDDGTTTTAAETWPGALATVGPQGWVYGVGERTVTVHDPATGGSAAPGPVMSVDVHDGLARPVEVGHLGDTGLIVLATQDGRLVAVEPPARHVPPAPTPTAE